MHLDGRIRQVPVRLEANIGQNKGMGRNGHGNGNREHGMSSHEQRSIIGLNVGLQMKKHSCACKVLVGFIMVLGFIL